MLLLGIDLETTGLDVEKDEITEIAAVIWDTERKTPLKIYNEYLFIDGEISSEIEEITGITKRDITQYGVRRADALLVVEQMSLHCDYVVAHNGNNFDRPFLLRYFNSFREFGEDKSVSSKAPIFKNWMDTKVDVDYPERMKLVSLEFLSYQHGFIPNMAHRALFDVISMLKVLSNYDINKVIENSNDPLMLVQALVSFQTKDLAKDKGFKWNPNDKTWTKSVKTRKFEAEVESYAFAYKILNTEHF